MTGYMDNGMDDFGEGDDNVESDDDGADRKRSVRSSAFILRILA